MTFKITGMAAALAAVLVTAGCAGLGAAGASGPGGTGGTGVTTVAAAAVSTSAGQATTELVTVSPGAAVSPAAPASAPAAGPAAGPVTALAAKITDNRKVTFVNHMKQTIWVAAAPNAASPLARTGWVLGAGKSITIAAPNNLNTRFWGRTGCKFNSKGVGHCQTGDCGGLYQCKGWGTIPATLAEVNFDAWDSLDFYDVSMVDGSNLPMYINITKSSGGTKDKISTNGCVPAGCTKAVACPSVLDVKAGGKVVGCISACARFNTDQLCCRGKWSSRAACNPTKWPVDYAAVFKRAEPYAYSYVDDDATSVFTCKDVCDYRITFGLTAKKK